MPPYQSIVFDFDGTLFDPTSGIKKALERTFYELEYVHGVSIQTSIEDVLANIGPPITEMLSSYVYDREALAKAEQTFRRYYDNEYCLSGRLYDNTLKILAQCEFNKIDAYIFTNKPIKPLIKILTKFRIENNFKSIYCIDYPRLYRSKTDMLKNLLVNEIPRSPIAVIGDRRSDKLAALENRISFIGCTDKCIHLSFPDDMFLKLGLKL